MIRLLIEKALNNRFIVLSIAVLLFLWGAIAFKTLPVEAYPDVANTWVQGDYAMAGPRGGRSRTANYHSGRNSDERNPAPAACAIVVAGGIVGGESDLRRRF